MGTRRSKHNYGRKPRYKDNGAEVCKAIWETPNFYKEPEPDRHPQEDAIRNLFSRGDSIREVSEKLNLEKKVVHKIGKTSGLYAQYEEARRNRARERSDERWKDDVFRELASQKQRENWRKRREQDATLVLPEEERTASGILAVRPHGDWQQRQWGRWSSLDVKRLEILAAAGVDPTRAAGVFRRSEKTIAYKARDAGIYIPPAWAAFLPKPKYIPHPREKVVLLNYPFAVKATAENEEILAVNKMIPKGWPDEMRADVCQELLLHVYQGKITMETLKGPRGPELVRQYGRHWRNENMERGGYGMMQIHDLDDDRSYDEIAAAREWDWGQMQEKRKAWESFQTFTPAVQLDEVYEKEVNKERMAYAERGEVLHHEEVERRLARGERLSPLKNLVAERIKIAKFVQECRFELCDKRDLNPSYTGSGHKARYTHYGEHGSDLQHLPSMQTQYVDFTIPSSAIRQLTIRVSDHAAHRAREKDLDTYKLGIDGVMRVLAELSGNVSKYEKVYNKWGDMRDLLNNGTEGFSYVR